MQRFDPNQLFQLFDTLAIPAGTRELIVNGFRQPARWLRATPFQAPPDLCCPKMGIIIHAANRLERRAAISYQFSPEVLGYIDSPFELHVKYQGRGGRPVEYNWAQGFLVFTANRIVWEDWHPFSSLVAKCKSNPRRFVRDGDIVRSPPFEEAASRLGIEYRLRSDRDIDPLSARNHEFLHSYLVDDVKVPEWFRSELREYFQINSYATLEELRESLPQRGLDDFHAALANGELTADLSRAFVGEPELFMVFRDAQAMDNYRQSGLWAEAHAAHYRWDAAAFRVGRRIFLAGNPFKIISVGDLEVVLQPDQGGELVSLLHSALEKAVRAGKLILDFDHEPLDPRDQLSLDSPLRFASPKAVEQAVKRLELLQKWESGDRSKTVTQYSDRTYRTWRHLRDQAMTNGLDVVIALVPQWSKRGNRNPRLSAVVETVVTTVIKEKFNKLTGRLKWSVFGDVRNELEKTGDTLSKQTFLARVRKAKTNATIAMREGRKAAYQAQPFYWVLKRDTPIHGDFPMQWVHIDHTPLEIEVIWAKTGESLGRPTLTLLMCAHSRRVVGFYLSLLTPRYISCMAAVLDMVRRFGRVPDAIIFDGGAEFGSQDFQSLLAFLRIGTLPRKASASRDGSLLERAFGWTQTMFVHNLEGNTKLRRNPRILTQETDPSGLAKYTLEQLYEGLEELFCDIYDTRRHGTLLMSPRQMFEQGLDRSGQRLNRLKKFEDCIPHAFPSVRGFTRTIDAQRGVRTNYGQYRNPRLESAMFDGLVVPTKYHPIDPKVIYVFVRNEWIPMFSSDTDESWRASTYFNMAHLEEQRVLESRTLDSQLDANKRVAALIERMNAVATDIDNPDPELASPALPSAGEESCAAGRAELSTLGEAMKALTERGYHGKRY